MFVKRPSIAKFLLSTLAVAALTTGAGAAQPTPFRLAEPAVAASGSRELGGELRKLSADQYNLFFGGEFASRTLSFFALPDEASSSSTLVLTLQTAISVAPEDSRMSIRINSTEVGSTGLVAGDARRVQFAVPAGVIHPGYNAITIAADQRHRVDCSIDATYELWTKIDPDKSGFLHTGVNRQSLSLVDLLPLSGTRNGRTSVRVVLPAGAPMSDYDRALNVVQALTILGNFSHPMIEFAATAGTGPGMDVYLGTRGELSKVLGDDHKAASSGDNIVVEAEDGERRRLVVTGSDTADLDARARELVSLAATDRPVGTPEGLTALVNLKGRTLSPGEEVSLRELGYAGKRFAGRYAQTQVNFTMPSDFYPGDYASMNLHLSALYVGGLAPDAVLTVKTNDKVVANIPLSSTREGEIRDQRLPIPFSVLRPGQNTLQIEARLPSRQDAACESVDSASSAVRLAINENSYLEIPDYARVGRYPDIAVLSSGLANVGKSDIAQATSLFVPNADPQAINAAATFISKMAYSSGHVQKVQYTSALPEMQDSNLIAFGSYDTLPSELTTRMNLDFINIKTAASKVSPLEVASLDNLDLPALQSATAIDGPQLSTLLNSAPNVSNYAYAFMAEPFERSADALGWMKSTVSAEMGKLNLKYLPAFLDDRSSDAYSPSADATLVVAQQRSGAQSVWTVVASRKSDAIATQTDILTGYNVWNKLGGAVESFSDAGQVIDRKYSADEHLFPTQPISLSNARLIAAGWLANNAEIYVGALLVTAILLGIGTFMVLLTGRRNDA